MIRYYIRKKGKIMPAAFIHENIAINALKKANKTPEYIINNMEAFELGAQGPDILFFYHMLKFWDKNFKPNELGETMHQKNISQFFKSAFKHAKSYGSAACAWIAGFITHYAADTTVHPFVYASTNNADGSQNTTKHLLLETQFDTWYHRKVQNNKGIPRQVSCIKQLNSSQKREIAHTLSNACNEVYPGVTLSYDDAYSCFADMKNVTNFLYSPHKIKYAAFRLLEKIVGKPNIIIRHAPAQSLPNNDFLNLGKNVWINPWDESIKSDMSFPKLFDAAVEKAAHYLNTVFELMDDKITIDEALCVLGNNSYSSGLPITQE